MQEADILDALRNRAVELPPLALELAGVEPRLKTDGRLQPDACIDARLGDRVFRFVAEFRIQTTPKSFLGTIAQVRAYAEAAQLPPLIVSPYLSPERLQELEAKGVSGVDLCGNGVVTIPGELLVMRTGNPNRYPASRGIANVYQGTTSLVARVFVARPSYDSVQEVRNEVANRGGLVSLGTVSKALRSLEEDLVISRQGRTSALLQADELFDRLAAVFKPPGVNARRTYRWNGSPNELIERLGQWSSDLVLTGTASVEEYGVMPREKVIQCYCGNIGRIEPELGSELEESPRFPDLELIETRDPTVFFDSRDGDTVPTSSPLQCWLELQAGDKRQRDAAKGIREWMIAGLAQKG